MRTDAGAPRGRCRGCSTSSGSRRGSSRLPRRRASCPGLEPAGVLGAALVRRGRVLRPAAGGRRGVRGEVVAARGGTIEIAAVRAIARDGGGWRLELSSGAGVDADAVVVAAGAASRALARAARLRPADRRGAAHAFPQRADPRAPARAARDRDRSRHRGEAARGRARARERPARDGDPATSRTRGGVASARSSTRCCRCCEFVSLPIVATGIVRHDAGRPADHRRARRRASGSLPGSAATGSWSRRAPGGLVADGLAGGALPGVARRGPRRPLRPTAGRARSTGHLTRRRGQCRALHTTRSSCGRSRRDTRAGSPTGAASPSRSRRQRRARMRRRWCAGFRTTVARRRTGAILFCGKIVVHYATARRRSKAARRTTSSRGTAIEFLEDSEALEFTPTAALERTFAAIRRNAAQ